MKTTKIVVAIFCLFLLALPAMAQSPAEPQATPPNIILIISDDLGYGELGCYGQQKIKTPNIDRLAQQGMRFTQFYSGSPVCAPSRCALMTGKHTGHAAIRDNSDASHLKELAEKYDWEFTGQRPLPQEEVTVAELLKARGYATAAMGKWGLGNVGTTGDPNRQGFDLFYGFTCQRHAHNHYPRFLWRNAQKETLSGNDGKGSGETYAQDKFVDEALRFIRDHQKQPFLLYLPFTIPHLSIQVPAESVEPYLAEIPEEPYEHTGYLKHPTPRAAYAAMISHMDRGVGEIVKLVDELELGPNTLILFTSDNGPTYGRLGGADSEFFGSAAGLRGLKGSVYEGGIRVPLVARWTGRMPAGETSSHLSASWDVLPTLCEAVGAPVPPNVDGLSFLPTLLGQPQNDRHEFLLWEFPSYGGQQAVRLGDWKAVRPDIARGNRKLELYHLQRDPAETDDVAEEHPEIIRQCEELLETQRVDSEAFPLFRDGKAAPAN